MYKTAKKSKVEKVEMKHYKYLNKEIYVKTHKCKKCNVIYLINPESEKYHQTGKCIRKKK